MENTDILNGIKAVIFDMDGTIIDSLHIWHDIDREFLGRYVKDPDLYAYQKALEGLSFVQVAEYTRETYDIPMEVEDICAEWNRMAEYKYANEIVYKPYAEEYILKLKERGIKLGVATSNSRHLVEKLIPRLHIDEYMSVILTGDEIHNGKPDPEIYLTAAKMLSVPCDKCLVFEDVIAGIEAGHNAGMKVCAVYDTATKDCDDIKRARADHYIKGYDELIYA
ncbi:MAG: HAD family phosphatase [Lachnospiraceae bacterium]|nr:HAD family phosphatase [Lachnospiraceae bacterium]